MLASVLQWLPSLQVVSGDMIWRGIDGEGRDWSTTVSVRAGEVSASIHHPAIGRMDIRNTDVTFTPVSGPALTGMLARPLKAPPLVASVDSMLDALAQVSNSTFASIRNAFAGIQGSVTVLVLPGISAFGVKTPPLSLGSFQLPSLTGSVSLRDVAIDLSGGHLGLVLRIHDAQGHGDAVFNGDGFKVTASDPWMTLAADMVIPFRDGETIVNVDRFAASAQRITFESSNPQLTSVLTCDKGGKLAIDSLSTSIDLKSGAITTRDGNCELDLSVISGYIRPVAFGALVADSTAVDCAKVSFSASVGTAGTWSGVLTLTDGSGQLSNPSINFPDGSVKAVLSGGQSVTMDFARIAATLPFVQFLDTHVSALAQIDTADLNLAGLKLSLLQDAEPSKVRIEGSVSGADVRCGLQVTAEHASLDLGQTPAGTPKSLDLRKIAINRFEEDIGLALAPKHRVLARRSVNTLGITIALQTLYQQQVPQARISVENVKGIADMLTWASSAFGVGGDAKKIVDALSKVLDMASDADRVLGGMGNFLGYGIDDVYVLLRPSDLKATLDNTRSTDRILYVDIKTGLDSIAIDVDVSYPDPTLTDWSRKGHKTIQLLDTHLGLDLPTLVIGISFTYDAPAKRFRVEAISFAIDWYGIQFLDQIGEAFQQIAMGYFGISSFIQGIVNALNLSFSDHLPESWDVSELEICKADDGTVKGLMINLRAFETVFNPIV